MFPLSSTQFNSEEYSEQIHRLSKSKYETDTQLTSHKSLNQTVYQGYNPETSQTTSQNFHSNNVESDVKF